MIALLKALHIGALVFWCAGLVGLPMMLAHHDPAMSQTDYARARRYTHFAYTMVITPAALLAVVSGTWLIFLREVYEPWLFAKLAIVVLLVTGHAWIGRVLTLIGESGGRRDPPATRWMLSALITPMLLILLLVLGKPAIEAEQLPDWLQRPQDSALPVAVPIR